MLLLLLIVVVMVVFTCNSMYASGGMSQVVVMGMLVGSEGFGMGGCSIFGSYTLLIA